MNVPAEVLPIEKPCPACGKPIKSEARLCKHCHRNLDVADAPTPTEKELKDDLRIVAWLAILASALVLHGGSQLRETECRAVSDEYEAVTGRSPLESFGVTASPGYARERAEALREWGNIHRLELLLAAICAAGISLRRPRLRASLDMLEAPERMRKLHTFTIGLTSMAVLAGAVALVVGWGRWCTSVTSTAYGKGGMAELMGSSLPVFLPSIALMLALAIIGLRRRIRADQRFRTEDPEYRVAASLSGTATDARRFEERATAKLAELERYAMALRPSGPSTELERVEKELAELKSATTKRPELPKEKFASLAAQLKEQRKNLSILQANKAPAEATEKVVPSRAPRGESSRGRRGDCPKTCR